jgi:GNAT superfamily N-acetyltransferase
MQDDDLVREKREQYVLKSNFDNEQDEYTSFILTLKQSQLPSPKQLLKGELGESHVAALRACYDDTDEKIFILAELAVDCVYQNKGLATWLIQDLISWVRKNKPYCHKIQVQDDSRHRLESNHNVYIKSGFKSVDVSGLIKEFYLY